MFARFTTFKRAMTENVDDVPCSSDHWGEIEDDKNEDMVKEMLESLHGKFRNGFTSFDLPPLHQPSSLHRPPKKE